MVLLVSLLLVTIAVTAGLRLAGFSRKSAVFWGSLPWALASIVSVSAFMILRTPDGRIVSKTERFATAMVVPVVLATVVSLVVRKKEPIQSSRTTTGSPGPDRV